MTTAEILEVARRCFLQHGPSVSTEIIAAELDISAPALFKRVGTKHDLLVGALTPSVGHDWDEVFRVDPTEAELHPQILAIVRVLDGSFRRLLPCLSVLRASGLEPAEIQALFDEPPPLRARRELARWIRRGVDAGCIRDTNADAAATAFLGAIHMPLFFDRILGDPEESDRDYLSAVADLLYCALREQSDAGGSP